MLKEYMTEEDRKKEAKKNKENEERALIEKHEVQDSNSRRSMMVTAQNSSILIPLNTLVSKLDSSFESGSKMDRSLSELTMKIFDVS